MNLGTTTLVRHFI
jgi:hypothetical protein